MTITYTWKITGLQTRNASENVSALIQVAWSKTGTNENGVSGVFNGATPFTPTTMPDDDVFVPVDQLTEEIVLKWVKDSINSSYEEYVNMQIMQQIEDQINPVIEPPLPWVPSPEPLSVPKE